MKYPEYYDPYVGKVYGNILDYYDNPAYNLRLYMIDDASSKEAPDEFGGAGPELVAEPSQTVILAQTGDSNPLQTGDVLQTMDQRHKQ